MKTAMRFFADGPSIPDELLVARDEGRVVFFCGAGVSRARVGLPKFFGLAKGVVAKLGVAADSPARELLSHMEKMDALPGMAGVISADRIFGLLEREFETGIIEKTVAEVLKPDPDKELDLSAHQTLLDLSTTAEGNVRLVTTNFDRLFEACNDALHLWTPPHFPDIERPNDFNGVIHLHGCVNEHSDGADGDGFVLSSSEFGNAYLADGWATEFVKAILDKYIVLFVGYGADDPPVQYLLEALNKKRNQLNGIYAFQFGDMDEAASRWYHKGVEAIAYSEDDGHQALWGTLGAWAERAKAPDAWFQSIVDLAKSTPEQLQPHERGQVAHVVSTTDGARKFAENDPPPPAEWLMVFDAYWRYAKPREIFDQNEAERLIDPFDLYGLDFDQMPHKIDPKDPQAKRETPQTAWDAFNANNLDRTDFRDDRQITLRGFWATNPPALPSRLDYLSRWISKIAHHPASVWWAAGQHGLQENLRERIRLRLKDPRLLSRPVMRQGWRYLFEAWEEQFKDRDHEWFDLKGLIENNGWDPAAVREFVALRRPYFHVSTTFPLRPKPPTWSDNLRIRDLLTIDVKYPTTSNEPEIPEEWLALVTRELRKNLEWAVQFETELRGYNLRVSSPIVPDEARDDRYHRSNGLSGALMHFVAHFRRLIELDASQAQKEMSVWPEDDDTIFARLRIWAGGFTEIVPREAFGTHTAHLSDEAFWDRYHQRDLLLVLAARWPELSADTQTKIEERLLRGSPRWEDASDGDFAKQKAWDSLTYITWLTQNGCEFSTDLNSAIENLRSSAPDWQAKYAENAANSITRGGGWVKTDTEHSPLVQEPLNNIIAKAEEFSGRSDDFLLKKDPFLGLSQEQPVRALAALTNAAKRNEYPIAAWRTFLRHDARGKDQDRENFSNGRFAMLIAERLIRSPDNALTEFLDPTTDWFFAVSDTLASRYSETFGRCMSRFLEMIRKEPGSGGSRVSRSSREPDWASHAINSPTGKIAQAIFKDPKTDGLKAGKGFPSEWITYVNEMLVLPSEIRPYALVIFAHNLVWFYAIDPTWTEENLLSVLDCDDNDNVQAVLSGFFWGHRCADGALFYRLKPYLLSVAKEKSPFGRENREEVAGHLLIGWGTKDEQTGQRSMPDNELRDVLLRSDEEFRSYVLSHLEHWTCEEDKKEEEKWQDLLLDFIRDVWPRQKIAKSPRTSAQLFELALTNPDILPQLVELLLPLITTIDRSSSFGLGLREEQNHQVIDRFPKQFLDLLVSVLPIDINAWPYGIGDTLNRIAEADQNLQSDGRLIELQRKWKSR